MKIKIISNLIFLVSMGILFPISVQAQGSNDLSYRDLIKKNFGLRKELKELNRKYIGLEEERKILILHVKELQGKKGSRAGEIQNLRNMISSLRIEMIKDPKLTKVIDAMSQKVGRAEKERDLVSQKVNKLESEKKGLIKKVEKFDQIESENLKLAKELKEIRDSLAEKERLSVALKEMRKEKSSLEKRRNLSIALAKTKKEKVSLKRENNNLEEELKEIKGLLKTVEMDLKANEGERENERNSFEKELKETKGLLEAAEIALETNSDTNDLKKELKEVEGLWKASKIALKTKEEEELEEKANFEEEKKKIRKELKQVTALLDSADKNLKTQVSKIAKEKNYLEKSSEKIQMENLELNEKITQFKDQVQESEKINQKLVADHKKEQTAFERVKKELKKGKLKNAFEKEHYEEKLKLAKDGKVKLEEKIKNYQGRVFTAETKFRKGKDELEKKDSKILLRESEVEVLKAEKSKLEEKLVRYIEKLLDQQDRKLNRMQRGEMDDWDQYGGLQEGRMKSKREIAERKLTMHYNLALAYDKQKRYKEEEKEYRKCLKINPKDANVHYNLAILYDDKLNKKRKAITHYKKFLDLHPTGDASAEVKAWMLYAEQEMRLGDQAK